MVASLLTVSGIGSVSVLSSEGVVLISGSSSSAGVWQDGGSVTLGADAQSITLSSIPAFDYLDVFVELVQQDASGVTTEELRMTFNGDTGSHYCYRIDNGVSGANQSYALISDGGLIYDTGDFFNFRIRNKASSTKAYVGSGAVRFEGAFGNQPEDGSDAVLTGTWQNTSDRISSITITSDPTAAKIRAGSRKKVIGLNL